MSIDSIKKILVDIIDGSIVPEQETHEEIENLCNEILEDMVYFVTEEYGRDPVHLLPEIFQPLSELIEIPDVLEIGVKETIKILGEMLGCSSYRTSLFEFWFLDVVADALIKSQKLGMSQGNQRMLIAWFCYFMKQLENEHDYDVFNGQLEKYLTLGAEYISENLGSMPSPEQIAQVIADSMVVEDEKEQNLNEITKVKDVSASTKVIGNKPIPKIPTIEENKKQGLLIEENLDALVKMATILKNIFVDELIFMMISSFFKKPPLYLDVYSPYEINVPREMLIVKTPETSTKKGKNGKIDKKESTPKGKKTTEVIEVAKEVVQGSEKDKEIDLRDFILPLQMAVQDAFFESLWPPGLETTASGKKAKGKPKK